MMLEAKELTLCARQDFYPVWKLDLQLGRKERLAVVGESGGGKTSLAWALMGRPLPGQRVLAGGVCLDGMNLYDLSSRELAGLYYRRMALVPQNAQNSFHPTQRLWESAQEVMQRAGVDGRGTRLSAGGVQEALAGASGLLDLDPSLWAGYPHQLSGGQKQRMALILALLKPPEVLLLDEPTHALDELTRARMMAFLEARMEMAGGSVVLFTHDIGMAEQWAHRTAVLYRGEIVEEIPGESFGKAAHPYTRALMHAAVRLGDAPLSRCGVPGHALPLAGMPAGCGFLERCEQGTGKCREARPRLLGPGSHKVRCFYSEGNGI